MSKQPKAKAIALSITQQEFLNRQRKRNTALFIALMALSGILYSLALIQL